MCVLIVSALTSRFHGCKAVAVDGILFAVQKGARTQQSRNKRRSWQTAHSPQKLSQGLFFLRLISDAWCVVVLPAIRYLPFSYTFEKLSLVSFPSEEENVYNSCSILIPTRKASCALELGKHSVERRPFFMLPAVEIKGPFSTEND